MPTRRLRVILGLLDGPDRHERARRFDRRQPANDLWIAATALAHDFTLVSADARLASLPLVRAILVAT